MKKPRIPPHLTTKQKVSRRFYVGWGTLREKDGFFIYHHSGIQ